MTGSLFADPADQELCAGVWKVTPIGAKGSVGSVQIEIAAVDPADGARAA